MFDVGELTRLYQAALEERRRIRDVTAGSLVFEEELAAIDVELGRTWADLSFAHSIGGAS